MLLHLLTLACLAWTTVQAQPCLSTDFSLALHLSTDPNNTGIDLSLNAIPNGSNGTLVLVAERLARYPGSPVALHGNSGNASLTIQINPANSNCGTLQEGNYGISVPDVGELYEFATPVLATKGLSWPNFFYSSAGGIQPRLTAASQLWFACNETIQGREYLTLSWGIFAQNGSAPMGCQATSVRQVYNIPCGNP